MTIVNNIDLHKLAHDLRSPLGTIRLVAEAALLNPELPDNTRKILLELIGEIDRLAKMTEKIIDL